MNYIRELKKTIDIVPYKYYIRQIVEASTVYERNRFDEHIEAMRIFAQNPHIKVSKMPQYIAIGGILFLFGCVVTIYAFII